MGAQVMEDRYAVVTATLDPASVDSATSTEQDFTITGVLPGDVVVLNAPALTAGLVICNVRVKSANTVSIMFGNLTTGAINPASGTYRFLIFRPEKTTSGRFNPP